VKAGAVYFGAGMNCVAGNCQKPQLPSPSSG